MMGNGQWLKSAARIKKTRVAKAIETGVSMRNWLLMLATLSVPCFGATLKGVVTDDNGIALYKTRIIVTHDLSLLISHAKRTDFNGLYHFDLNPGPTESWF